ncbi:MAG TPA: 16S rRNA (uracil(1498)-N(3))-methyltransferase [Acetobacteraceae bacterium]|nr:16S rRNA (uracil(1498)-N(3))-methyltransferase [Acetobacteraceae bacterium]
MSTLIRLFVPDALAPGAVIATNAGQAHYLGNVMRRSAGEALLLFNGRDGEWRARIGGISRKEAILHVDSLERPQAAEPDMILAFAPLKRDATELVVEKATELGVSAIMPVLTARGQTARLNLDRLGLIAAEAAEQSERLSVPEIRPPIPLEALLRGWPMERRLAVAAERREAPPLAPPMGGLLIGPEGGFTERELDGLAQCPFVSLTSLGDRILRAETAAIAGLARLLASPLTV